MLNYQKHQRDYTILGTSVVFEAYCGEKVRNYFSYEPNPMYILLDKGVLFHFTAEEDSQGRAKSWLEKYRNLEALSKHKEEHDRVLKAYREFLELTHDNSASALKTLHWYFADLLPVILVAIEVPELVKDNDNQLYDLCMQIRKENEDVYKVGMDLQNRLLRALEQDKNIEEGRLSFLTSREFIAFESEGKLPAQLSTRQEFILVQHTIQGEQVFYDHQQLKDLHLEEEAFSKNISEFRGQVAFPGKVTGKARIITFVEDANQLQEGEVLVTAMTDPRYVPIMKKAAAIVTNEGGITCHAAIVSRELKKPCIVGTKIATQVLENGNLIEVDANSGLIKKL